MIPLAHAAQITQNAKLTVPSKSESNNKNITILVFVIAISFSLFAGLRTSYNDTHTYIENFEIFVPTEFSKIDKLGDPKLFAYLQIFIKKFFLVNSSQWLLVITSTIVNFSFVIFYYKHSNNFLLSIIFYIIIGPLLFSMGGIKQSLAMAFGLIAISCFLSNKKVFFVFWIVIAYFFHPFAWIYFIVPFLTKKPWSSRTIYIVAGTAIVALFYDKLVPTILSVAEASGRDDYSENLFTSGGMNVFRLLVVIIIPIFTFLFRKQIYEQDSILLNIAVNLNTFSLAFYLVASISSPIYFGRLATYVSILDNIIFPWILINCFKDKQMKVSVIISALCFYLLFLYFDITKFGTYTWLDFNHASFWSLF